jgi:cellulose synthase/poly-beta-1,6-N-acetylglucosamine synthase-like glycosyltransferase
LLFSLIPFGIVAAYIALTCGFFFFLYAAKYYISLALMLITAGTRRQSNAGNNMGNGLHNGLFGFLRNRRQNNRNGLAFNHNEFHLEREPFVSIHLPMYNESRVVDRLLTACTSLEYNNYEVIVGDDSTDGTLEILEKWAQHPKVKVSHRLSRKGFKGIALQRVLEVTDPKTEFIIVFDADFIPPQNIIQQFLFYFYPPDGNGNNERRNDNVAVVQGYQWHMLNADENWLTKGVRTEYSGSYVIERSVEELFGSMKMISGSVYMMRVDVLRQLEWGSSITEDWELTLRLYQAGYKVLFTPFIQAPAECISDFARLQRQRMRWAEGHTHQVKRHF